jgi:hypothetical protein
MHDYAGAALAMVAPQAPDPVDDRLDPGRPGAPRDGGSEMNKRVAARRTLPVPGPPATDGDLDLDHRLEPVGVRALEESDLDLAHGPARITSTAPRKLAEWNAASRRRS